jgi:hypothetical protein
VYYNRARVYEQAGNLTKALKDWELLLALPPDQVPTYWLQYAEEHVTLINPATPSETPEGTNQPAQTETTTGTPGPNRTPTPSPTPKK